MEGLSKRDWREKEPKSLEEVGEREGIMPRGKPFPKSETCCILRARLARAPSMGKGSPGMAFALPSRTRGVAKSKSQNAESMAVLSLAMVFVFRVLAFPYLSLFSSVSIFSSLLFWDFEMRERGRGVFVRFLNYKLNLILVVDFQNNTECVFDLLN